VRTIDVDTMCTYVFHVCSDVESTNFIPPQKFTCMHRLKERAQPLLFLSCISVLGTLSLVMFFHLHFY
jgi:hypothetical protein